MTNDEEADAVVRGLGRPCHWANCDGEYLLTRLTAADYFMECVAPGDEYRLSYKCNKCGSVVFDV
jgi:hypothetical protein